MKSVILGLTLILGTQVFKVNSAAAGAIDNVGVNDHSDTGVSGTPREKRGAPAKCGKTFKVTTKPQAFSSSEITSQPECEWIFIGDTTCFPEITCSSIDIPKSDDCADASLLISDGFGGQKKFCGKVAFDKPLLANDKFKARDLFARYEGKKGDFKCNVACSSKKDGLRLPLEFVKKEEPRCVCGLQNKDDRIVGGEDSKMNEFPWQAAIVFSGTRSPKCGASVINDRFILTATHCFFFEGIKPAEIEVLIHAFVLDMTKKDEAADVPLGQEGSIRGSGYNLKEVSDAEENTQRYKVAEIIQHPFFTESYDYDYALLRLEKKIDLASADAPTPVCLPELGSFATTYEGTNPWVVGWGMPDENAGGTTRVLQKLSVPIIPMKKCESWMPGLTTQRMICAGYEDGKKDACTGDSGGPLILQNPSKQWAQIGIVSWGEGCAQKHKPGLYSRVTEMQQWIYYYANQHDAKWCKDTK